jgi:UDP-N-acetylglucosamine 2-epimerase (non-hydrolysing)
VRLVSVIGARPQFVKLAPISQAARDQKVDHVVIHTGQHYDNAMSGAHFSAFSLPEPDLNLNVGSGSHGEQTGTVLIATERVLAEVEPDWVLVYGDTNSTLAATLAAIKLGIPVAHLEAGLRSFNRHMPEEHNRVLTDHAADLLLAPTQTAVANLDREGLQDRTVLVGDVMADVCLATARSVTEAPPRVDGVPTGGYLLATIHRPYNTDDPERLARVLSALAESPVPVVLAAHPRLVDRAASYGITLESGAISPIEPLNYPQLIAAVRGSQGVVTDSGGLQKEAYLLQIPCTTVRSETEWVETLVNDWNVLCFDNLTELVPVALRSRPSVQPGSVFGDGHAAQRVIEVLLNQQRR